MGDDYTNTLERDTRDLVELAAAGTLPPVRFREPLVRRVIEMLSKRRSVLLTGASGVGKTAVVHAIAHRLVDLGTMALRETSTTRVMSGTKYLGEWQSKISALVKQADDNGAVLYLSDVWNVPTVGRTSQDPSNLLDALGPLLEARQVVLLGEASTEVLRAMERVPGFTKLFEHVIVPALTTQQAREIVSEVSARHGAILDEPSLNAMLTLTSRFLPQRPQPGPALSLVANVISYRDQKTSVGENEALDPEFIERVFSIYSGLPLFVVSQGETRPAGDIRAWFQERIVGQQRAIEAVVETIALFKAGLHDPTRPIGAFLFVGPTGVGKTELARKLAEYLFGSATRLLRFDMSEFKDYHAFEMLLGDPKDPWRPARLIDPVRQQPFQVVLFDELEKGHSNVSDLLLQLLDDGRLTPPGGEPVNFRNTIVIATSNVGAQGADRAMGFGATAGATEQQERIRKALESAFRPELLNRFQHIVVFDSLTPDQLRTVARQELSRILAREGIAGRKLIVDVADEALDLVIESGVDPRYGARSLKRELQRQIVLPLAMTLMEKEVEPGTLMVVGTAKNRIAVKILDTPESARAKEAKAPITVPGRRRMGRAELKLELRDAKKRVETIAAAVDEEFLRKEHERLDELRKDPAFYANPAQVAPTLREMDWATTTLARLDRLRARIGETRDGLEAAITRPELQAVGSDLGRLDTALQHAHRELVVMGLPGLWDALVEVRPTPGERARAARDLLVETYRKWAEGRSMTVVAIRDPLDDQEAVAFAVQGPWAYGLLRLESGVHRLRDGDHTGVCTVTVGPWTDATDRPTFETRRALKGKTGQCFGRVKSRLECQGGLVLQNERTIAANIELAKDLCGPWDRAPAPPEAIVRRYGTNPWNVRDVLTGQNTGRPDALSPRSFHELLCRRVRDDART